MCGLGLFQGVKSENVDDDLGFLSLNYKGTVIYLLSVFKNRTMVCLFVRSGFSLLFRILPIFSVLRIPCKILYAFSLPH